jgi:phosphatidylglycerophosphatase A
MPDLRSAKQFFLRMMFTGFFTGYSPFAPGTTGTLVAVVLLIIEYLIFGHYVWVSNLIIVILTIYPSVMIADAGEKYFNRKDPESVVIDEILGYWVSVLFFPFSWITIVSAFILFRIMDITKPFPIKKSENFSGGFGIMLDDIISGIYANIILRIIILISGAAGLKIFL